jgi:hypothetical protein
MGARFSRDPTWIRIDLQKRPWNRLGMSIGVEGAMSLQFVGDDVVYFPDKDVIKITAIAGDGVIDCYVSRSALAAMGCKSSDQAADIIEKFEARRLDCETAAMVKFRRAMTRVLSLEITAADLDAIERSREAYFRSSRRLQRFAQRLGVLSHGPALPGSSKIGPVETPRSTEREGLSILPNYTEAGGPKRQTL